MTVASTHTIATSRMTREAFYVAMTRGTRSNRAYVATDAPSSTDTPFDTENPGGDEVLAATLARRGAEQSAHQRMAGLHPTRTAGTSARQHMQQRSTTGISR